MQWSTVKLISTLAILSLCASYHGSDGYSIDQQVEAEFLGEVNTAAKAQQEEENAFEVYNPEDENEDNKDAVESKEQEDSSYENSLLAVMSQAGSWTTSAPKTNYRQSFQYVCAPGSALSHMYSVHSNAQEDRLWQFMCRKVSTTYPTNCQWTAPHGFDAPLNGMCAAGYAVTGIRSLQYSAFHRDRQFSVQCCKLSGIGSCCKTTPNYINGWDAVLNYQAQANRIITGIHSIHNNQREDRIFKVKTCDLTGKITNDCAC